MSYDPSILDDASIEETIRVQKELKRKARRDWLYYHSLKYLIDKLIANHRQKIINKIMAKNEELKNAGGTGK